MILVLTPELWDQIKEIAYRTPLETGVTLFGAKDGERRVVKAIADPGRKAIHQQLHYSGDADYASDAFAALRLQDPAMEWLGELHAHPPGMTWLSRGDRKTIAEILLGTDDSYHPEEFVAGVIQRVSGSIAIYPVHFSKSNLKGEEMEVLCGTNIFTQQNGAGNLVAKAYRYCRSGQWRRRCGRYGGSRRNGKNHAD